MGILPMSLINQMLQELDSRRGEASGVGTYGAHVRAVPERRGIHAAWWVALTLAILLAGMIVWIVTRPVHAPVIDAPDAQLPLRMSADIDISKLSMRVPPEADTGGNPIASVPSAQIANLALASGATLSASDSSAAKSSPEEKQATRVQAKPAPAIEPSPVLKEDAVSQVVEPQIKAPVATDMPKAADVIAAVAAQKQIRELTVQQRAENEYRKATSLIQQGKQEEAVAALEQVLQLDGQHTAARQALIGLLLDAKRQDEAISKARDGLRQDGSQTGLAMILARLQLEKGELKPAIETLERSQAHAMEKTDYQSFLAALLQRDNRNKEAAELYMRVLQRAPHNGVWWMGLGISLQAENRLAEAQEAFGRAKASSSLSPELSAFVESRLKQLQR